MVTIGRDTEAEHHYAAEDKCCYITFIDTLLPLFRCSEGLSHGHIYSAVVLDQAVPLLKIEDVELFLRLYHQVVNLGGGAIAEISKLFLCAGRRQTQALIEHNWDVGHIQSQCSIGSLTDCAVLTLAHGAEVVKSVYRAQGHNLLCLLRL